MKKYIVRMLCSSLPCFVYVYTDSEEEAKEAVTDPMCYSVEVNEVKEQ